MNALGVDLAFWCYAVICIAGLVWGRYYIPETKGRSLEEIEHQWRIGGTPRNL